QPRGPRGSLRPGERLPVLGGGGSVPPQLGIEPSLRVQHPRHLVGASRRLEALARAPQKIAGGREIALLPRQHAEPALQPPHLPLVARRLGEAQPAAVPCLGAPPLTLRERHVPQSLACRDRARLIELRFVQGERALELTRTSDMLPEAETQIPEAAQRLHIAPAVPQRFRQAERQPLPLPR